MQLPNLQFIRSIPVWGPRLYEAFNAVQQQTTRIETQGNLNATGDPPVPPPPDALNVTNGPSGEYQIAITHNGEFNRGTTFHVQWDTSPHFTNPHNIDLGASRNDSSLYLPGQTAYFRAAAASPGGSPSTWTYHGSQNRPVPVVGGIRGVRAPGMGSGVGPSGGQVGGPGGFQERNSTTASAYKLQQRTAGTGFGASAQGSPAGVGASAGTGGGGGGGGVTLTEAQIAAAETLTTITGTGNAIIGVTVPAYSVRAVGFVLRYIPINANSGATTINVNSIGAVAVTDNGGNALVGGEFVVGKASFLIWDGTEYQIVGVIIPLTTKGDVLTDSGSGLVRLPVGTNGEVLTANSAAADGIDWEAPITLTTVGSSGAASLTPGNPYVLNVPVYAAAGFSGTVTLAALTALGTQGSITFVNGLATAAVDPT